MIVGDLYVFFGKCIFRSSAHILIRLFEFFFYVELYEFLIYIVNIISYQTRHLQIFSPIQYVVFFVLLIVSFTVRKLLGLIRSHLFMFAFVFFALGEQVQKKKKKPAMIYIQECSTHVFFNNDTRNL